MRSSQSAGTTNKDIVRLLRNVGTAYLIKNENRFKVLAYERAADQVELLTRELIDIWKEGKLDDVGGIGSSIASHLSEYFEKGHSKYFEKVLKDIPETVFELMEIPTLGPKKAFKLAKIFNLTNPKTIYDDLKKHLDTSKNIQLPPYSALLLR